MDQARAGLSALQLAGPQESARRVAIGLRGVKSEENRRPDHRMTAPRKVRKRRCEDERKSVGQFRLHCMPKTASDRIPIFSAGQTPRPTPDRGRGGRGKSKFDGNGKNDSQIEKFASFQPL